MKRKIMAAMLAAALLSGAGAQAGDGPSRRIMREAISLYEGGMYERAQTLFESLGNDAEARGYAVLCAATLQTPGYESLVEAYEADFPGARMADRIHYRMALNAFSKEDYEAASLEFMLVDPRALPEDELAEYTFKRAYSDFGRGDLANARRGMEEIQGMPFSDYTGPSRYALGYIAYAQKDFPQACTWFEQSAKDPRFADLSNYYLLECKFMQKDYRYVVENGIALYDSVPEERRPHLARILSESYLVMGDAKKARSYYDSILKEKPRMNRSDWFYAGSVLYAVEDWQGAVENFTMMTDRVDSLGQIANYQLGYAYIKTKNKVAAMDAFKDASVLAFDPAIQEDAYFNYAKLAFDLNHDTSVFSDYIAKYNNKQKNDKIWSYQALAALYNRDYAGAVAAYDNVDDLTPDMRGNYMKANYLRANQLISNGSWRDAVPMLRAAAYYGDRRDPFNQLARYWLAESYFNAGQFAQARATLTDLYNTSALDGREEGKKIPYDIAYTHFRDGSWAEASKWFDKYLREGNPAFARDAAVRRADCDFYRKDYKDAIAGYKQAIEAYGGATDDLYPWYQCGLAYGLTGAKNERIEVLSAVKEASPTTPWYSESLYELGRAYVAVNDEDDAIRAFKTLKGTTKDNTFAARALIELGMLSRNRGEAAQALDYYKQVVEQLADTGYAEDAMLAVESIYQSEGQADAYLAYAEKVGAVANKTDAEKETLYFNAGEQLYLAGNYGKALGSLETYRSKYPNGSRVEQTWFYTAECLRAMDKKEPACDAYAKVTGGEFAEPAARALADLSYGMEKYGDAYDAYRKLQDVARIEGNVSAARIGAMRSAYRGHQWEEALAAADAVKGDKAATSDLLREADYVKAKASLARSDRDKAFSLFENLSRYPATDEGAEACFQLIQRSYDTGDFADVEKRVYKLAQEAPGQNYWLAKAFIVLGDSFAERDNLVQAKATFESVQNGYTPSGPDDDVPDNVRMRLEKLQKMSEQ